jgi:hypothetical protein
MILGKKNVLMHCTKACKIISSVRLMEAKCCVSVLDLFPFEMMSICSIKRIYGYTVEPQVYAQVASNTQVTQVPRIFLEQAQRKPVKCFMNCYCTPEVKISTLFCYRSAENHI